MRKTQTWLVLAIIAVLAVGLVACKFRYTKDSRPGAAKPPQVVEGTKNVGLQASGTVGYSDITERAVKSVVNISSTKVLKSQPMGGPFFNDPFFRRFFGDPRGMMPRERRERALGSGVIVSKDGYILTNNHVVADADEVQVLFPDGRELRAKIIGADEKSDVAVIKVEGENFDPLPLGESSKLRLGEVVLAIGNPFGLSGTVTMGIVSALGRANVGITDYEDFIQTDAAINPGNSGGALINTRGELVGVNTAIFSRTGGYEGIGFAIPINMARSVMDSLVKYGRVERGYLGVNIQDLKPEMAEQFGLKTNAGALISDVAKDSPAEKAGLKRGDVVISLNGQTVSDAAHFRNLVSQTPVGADAEVTIMRDRSEKKLTVTVGRNPADKDVPLAVNQPEDKEEADAGVGMTVANLTRAVRQRFDMPADLQGVVVVRVDPGGSAADAGLRPGDVIMEANRQPLKGVADLKRAIDQAHGDRVMLLINRGGVTSYLLLRAK
jgi:serine protease Do